MVKVKSPQKSVEKWVRNSIKANPDRILGVVHAYFENRQTLKWVVGSIKGEDIGLIKELINPFKEVDSVKYEALLQALED